jgi:diguanylate cyclase (GGDEF)-like protein
MDERSLRHVVLGVFGVLGLGAAALASHDVSAPAGFFTVTGLAIAFMYGTAAFLLGWFAIRRGSARHVILSLTLAVTAGAYLLLSARPHAAGATYMWAVAHIVLPIGLIGALLGGPKALRTAFTEPSTRLRATAIAGGYIVALLAILYFAPIRGRLPLLKDPTQVVPLALLVVVISAAAVGLGLRRGRREDLESWLTVVAAANLVDAALMIGAKDGGTVGVLVARIVALIASLAMLRAVMQDAGRLWAKMGSARFAPLEEATGVLDEREVLTQARHLMPKGPTAAPLTIVLFAIDGVQDIYDQYGHLTGDRVVAEVARRLHTTLRDADVVGQRADESFLVLLPETDVDGARIAVDRALEIVRTKAISGVRDSVEVTCAAGVAEARGGDDLERVLGAAAAALEGARSAGGNRLLILAATSDSPARPGSEEVAASLAEPSVAAVPDVSPADPQVPVAA